MDAKPLEEQQVLLALTADHYLRLEKLIGQAKKRPQSPKVRADIVRKLSDVYLGESVYFLDRKPRIQFKK